MELVSVIVPMYRGEKYIEQAVRSALAQTYRTLEVIVVDDGSPDEGAAVVEGIHDDRLRMIRQQNQGVAGARNTGLSEASGTLIAFLDQDDIWHPHKLAAQVPLFADPEVAAVGALMTYLGPKGPMRATSGEIADHQRELIASAKLMPFAPSSMVIRAATLRNIGGFDRDLLVKAGPVDDLDVLSRVARVGRVLTVPEPLGLYRIHTEAGTFDQFYEMQRATRFLQDRISTGQKWEEWEEQHRSTRSERRFDRAKYLYRAGGLSIASGHRVRGAARLAGALAISPRYVVTRLRRQLT